MFSFLGEREEKILKKENPLRIIMEYPEYRNFPENYISSQSSTPPNYNYLSTLRTFQRNEIFSSNHSACDEKGEGGEKKKRMAIACNAFRDCVPIPG